MRTGKWQSCQFNYSSRPERTRTLCVLLLLLYHEFSAAQYVQYMAITVRLCIWFFLRSFFFLFFGFPNGNNLSVCCVPKQEVPQGQLKSHAHIKTLIIHTIYIIISNIIIIIIISRSLTIHFSFVPKFFNRRKRTKEKRAK